MNVLDRINSQTIKKTIVEEPKVSISNEIAPNNEIIEPEKLKLILMEEIKEKPPEIVTGNIRKFNGIEDFVVWYFGVRDKFSEGQKVALSTLIQARDAIFQGCRCKEAERRVQFNGYFKTFWENNKTTDLPAKVLEAGNFDEVSFRVEDIEFIKFNK